MQLIAIQMAEGHLSQL